MTIEDNINASRAAKIVAEMIQEESLQFTGDVARRYWEQIVRHVMRMSPEECHPQPKVIDAKPMRHEELCAFGMERLEFGKHKGRMVDEVDLGYLEWLDSQPDFRKQLRRYLAAPTIQSQMLLRDEPEDTEAPHDPRPTP